MHCSEYLTSPTVNTERALTRLGEAIARLGRARPTETGLERVTMAEQVDRYRESLHDLTKVLPPSLLRHLSGVTVAHSEDRVVHGDPSPENFIDTAGAGVLIDWERVHIGPYGPDLARALLTAELTLPGGGVAVLRGAGHNGPLPIGWLSLAGVHLAAWRHCNRDRATTPPWSRWCGF
ncbi:MAG TPA: hypothetical protein DGG94_20205 [Micromonosporaceae bacterium]|nr:hypothetical protein [Micromonosporaceae bacterium]HCU52088.1 hypothetical protein [Micromonosporaceae bacterium]